MKMMTRSRPVPLALRLVSGFLLLIQPFIGCPAAIAGVAELVQEASPQRARLFPTLPAQQEESVAVNRTVPPVAAPGGFHLASDPSDSEITACGIFSEPLVPQYADPKKADNSALSAALHEYNTRGDSEDISALTEFCQQHAESRWTAAVEHNLGLITYSQGYFSRA